MKYSLFDSFKNNLQKSYSFLNDYDVKFTHCGDDEHELIYFLEIKPITHTLDDLQIRMNISKKIKDFGKLFSIKILTLTDY